METRVARTSINRNPPPNLGHFRSPKIASDIPSASILFNRLLIRLALDPRVRSIEYIASIPISTCRVDLGMLVANRDDGRFAYDLVDERPVRDLDTEGLLLLALEQAGICLIEMDRSQIDREPTSGNCSRVWRYRTYPVDASVRIAIDRALADHRVLSIRDLGSAAQVSSPMKTVFALACEGALEINLTQELSAESMVAKRPSPSTVPASSGSAKRRSDRRSE
jgi:hypothetical protein